MQKKQVLSCIQPTGSMHLGNYLGAIQNWVALQPEYQCIYGVVDYHAMTLPKNPAVLRQNVLEMLIDLVACGVSPDSLFVQSQVPEHTELGWILGCVTAYGELARQTQFKDKSEQIDNQLIHQTFVSTGLFTYPVLQAADILMYHADYVPVGKDQEQHLELARNIALRFNHTYECSYFKPPQCLLTAIPKVMSFAAPNKKMSKSLGEKHYISLFESDDSIRKKIKSAVTDEGNFVGMSAGIENMFELLHALGAQQVHESLLADFNRQQLKYSTLKEALIEVIIRTLTPIRQRKAELIENPKHVLAQIDASAARIRCKARQTLKEVREIVGLYRG